jgi:tetratricopeptide (TPR) repeat protein
MEMKRIILGIGIIAFNTSIAQTLKDAIRMTDNEEFESAAKVFEKLISSEPGNGSNYYYYGENYFKNDMPEKAKEMYQKGIDVSPGTAINYVGLGKMLYLAGNSKAANDNFFKAKTISKSRSADVLMGIAEVYIVSEIKNVKEAINLLNQAIELEPKNPEIYTLLGDAYLEQNDGNTAILNYEKALDIDKKFTKAILREGKLYSRAKNYNLALDYYNRAILIDSTFAPAFRERAELRFRAGQSERAAADYQKYLNLNDNISARTRFASFKFVSKDYKTAINEINEIQKKDTTDINLYRLLGYSYYETGQYADGLSDMEKYFSKAEKVGKKLIETDYEYLGKNQMKVGEDSLGAINLLKAIQMDTNKTDLYGDIAIGCMKAKNYPCVITNLERKILIAKGKGGANDYFYLGKSYYFTKDFVKADTCFAQLIILKPELPIGYLWRAYCKTEFDKDLKKGLSAPYYEMFIEKVGTDSTNIQKNKKDLIDAYVCVGYNYLRLKNYPKAKEAYLHLKEIDPDSIIAKKALADVNLK